MPETMKQTIQKLENGDPTETVDLKFFLKEANHIINMLGGIPSYRLMVADLVMKTVQVDGYLRARKER